MPLSVEESQYAAVLIACRSVLTGLSQDADLVLRNMIGESRPEDALWCATVSGLFIGLEGHIKMILEAISDHPVMRSSAQSQPVVTEGNPNA